MSFPPHGKHEYTYTIVRTVDYFYESTVYSFVLEYMNFNLVMGFVLLDL